MEIRWEKIAAITAGTISTGANKPPIYLRNALSQIPSKCEPQQCFQVCHLVDKHITQSLPIIKMCKKSENRMRRLVDQHVTRIKNKCTGIETVLPLEDLIRGSKKKTKWMHSTTSECVHYISEGDPSKAWKYRGVNERADHFGLGSCE